jgi:sulfate transport system ATP-binding protein
MWTRDGFASAASICSRRSICARGRSAAVAYVRPHNIHLTRQKNGVPSIEVIVRHIHAAGPIARVELERTDTGEELEAELPRREERELALSVGDTAFASLREARVFPASEG